MENNNSILQFCNKETIVELTQYFSKFNFDDLCKAVFCINSWRYNRAHISLCIALNYALCTCGRKGHRRIIRYNEFRNFCKHLYEGYDSILDDNIIPDFGEIKIKFSGHFYPVIMGTGFDLMFPFLQSLETISKAINIENEIKEVLDYCEKLITKLAPRMPYNSKKSNEFTLKIPSEWYFDCCTNVYQIENLGHSKVLSKLCFNGYNIDTAHFLCKSDDHYYILFNSSILVDAYNKLVEEKKISEQEQLFIADKIVLNAINANYDTSSVANRLFYKVALAKDYDNQRVLDDVYINVAYLNTEMAVFFVDSSAITQEKLVLYEKKAKDLLNNGKLMLVMCEEACEGQVVNLTGINDLYFIHYSPNIIMRDGLLHCKVGMEKDLELYDLVSILYQSESIDTIIQFFKFFDKKKISTMGYLYSPYFTAWVENGKTLSKGALISDSSLVMSDVYMVEWGIFENYIKLSEWYPFDSSFIIFDNPYAWRSINIENSFVRIYNKALPGFGGDYKRIGDTGFFLSFDLHLEDLTTRRNYRSTIVGIISNIIESNLVHFEKVLIDSGLNNYKLIQFLFIPFTMAKSIMAFNFESQNKNYVTTELINQSDSILIKYTVAEDRLINDIMQSEDKSVECDVLKELLFNFSFDHNVNYSWLADAIDRERHNKKEVDVELFEMEYYFSENNIGIKIDDSAYIKVRNLIAEDCKKVGIMPNAYDSKTATKIIRRIQSATILRFQREVAKFDKIKLHKLLLSQLAYFTHMRNIDAKCYQFQYDNQLSDEARMIAADISLESRENNKSRMRDTLYLIDSNLSIIHQGDILPNNEDLSFLMAYSHWLINLQECADQAYYDLFGAKVVVKDDFLVETLFDDHIKEESNKRIQRIYKNNDYIPSYDVHSYFDVSNKEFQLDTGIYLSDILLICQYMALECPCKFKNNEILPDVFQVGIQELLEDLENNMDDVAHTKNLEDAINYLLIDESKIKQSGDVDCEFIPIWEREKRVNRYEVKPLVRVGESIIFSPVLMYNLFRLWEVGTIEFYPPYEYGLRGYMNCLTEQKSLCEHQMEKAISALFKDKNLYVLPNLKLHKVAKQFGHPEELGDYDVIAIDVINKIIWNVESKFLIKVGSVKEYYNHQYSFFISDKKDEKFSRRIKYLEKNVDSILKQIGECTDKPYLVKSYMVTNKVFCADIKKIDFEIITYAELSEMLNEFYFHST